MDFRYLEAFGLVAREKSFAKAAKILNISASAVTRQIKLLEASCKVQLFVRSTNAVALTERGQRLYNTVQRFYSELHINQFIEDEVTIRFGILEGLVQSVLCPKISAMKESWNIFVEVASPDFLVEKLISQQLDMAIITPANETLVPAHLKLTKILEEEIVLISKRKIKLDKIHMYPWVCFEPNTWITRYHNRQSEQIIRINNMNAIIDLVSRGVGISMVPKHCLAPKTKLHVTPVPEYGQQPLYLATPQASQQPKFMKQFIELLEKDLPSNL